jgi:ABC-type multidrug transport system fused ATPase/permease subunit
MIVDSWVGRIMAQELEILKVLADLAILLISITIPTYAIAISFLGSEYSKTSKEILEEKEKMELQLSKQLTSKAIRLEEMKSKIDEYEAKKKKIRARLRPLSLTTIVVLPSLLFGLSLLSTSLGLLNFPLEFKTLGTCLAISTALIFFGLVVLFWALVNVQKVAQETVKRE